MKRKSNVKWTECLTMQLLKNGMK